MTNRIQANLADGDRAALLAKLDEIKTALPFLVDLDAEDIGALPKLGDNLHPFTRRALELAREDDSFLPRNLDVDEFARDLALYEALEPLVTRLTRLLDLVRDTRILAGSDAYTAALDVYAAAKRHGKAAGLEGLLTTLGKRFANRAAATESSSPSA